jgi:WD40 repeat protein
MRTRLTLLLLLLLSACGPAAAPSDPLLLYVEADEAGGSRIVTAGEPVAPFPLQVSEQCAVYRIHPSPATAWVAIEFDCTDAPLVVFVWVDFHGRSSGSWRRSNSRFLAWAADGQAAYLKADPFGSPQIVLENPAAEHWDATALPPSLYDLAVLPDGRVIYSTTLGLGYGSQTWTADADGGQPRQVMDWPDHIVAYLSPSPNGIPIAFIVFPDSETPFPNGALFVLEDGREYITDADAGHGYAPAWSPDGTRLAFVHRDNPDDPQADLSAGALRSNIYLVEFPSQSVSPLTSFPDAIVETPAWSPDGSRLVFNVVRNGTIQIWQAAAGDLQPLTAPGACCAAWVPGR